MPQDTPDEQLATTEDSSLEAELEQIAAEESAAAREQASAESAPYTAPQSDGYSAPEPGDAPAEPETLSAAPVSAGGSEGAAGTQASDEDAPIIDVEPQPNSPEFDAEGFVEQVAAVERSLAEAKKAHNKAVSAAKSAVKKARSEYDAAIKRAEKALERTIASYAERVTSFAGATLFYDRITYESRRLPLAPEVHAEMEIREVEMPTSEASTSEAQVRQEVVVKVTSPQGTLLVTGDAERADTARKFVAEVNNTAAESAQRSADKEKAIDDGNARIRELRADTAAIEQAEATLREVEADTADIERISSQLNQLESSASDVEREALDASRKAARSRKFTTRLVAICAVVVIILIIVMHLMMR